MFLYRHCQMAWRHVHANHQFFLYYGSRQAQRKSLENEDMTSPRNRRHVTKESAIDSSGRMSTSSVSATNIMTSGQSEELLLL